MAVLSIDQGTSGTKALVTDRVDGVLAVAEIPVRPNYLDGGGVEVDPMHLLDSVIEAGRQALQLAGRPVDAVALANQGETVLAWDPSTGTPLTAALVWQDSRAASICAELAAHADSIAQRSGLVLDPYFSAPKMTWLRRNLTTDGVVTTSDTWLLHQLTGEFVTDETTASRSLILDIDERTWSSELLERFGLGNEALPRLVRNDEVIGTTKTFGSDLPVAGVVVDQQAALFAESCLDPGSAKCTYGTGAFLLANVGATAARSSSGLTTSVAWSLRSGAHYCVDGQVYTAASAVRWIQELGLIDSAADLDGVAAESAGGVQFVPALAGLAAPWWQSDASAAFLGLRLSTGRAELVRAVIEAIAANVAELVGLVSRDTGVPVQRLRVDGGLTQSSVLMQAQADFLQVPVDVYPSAHATALGAAAFAHLALDPSLSATDAIGAWVPVRTYIPRWSADQADVALSEWSESVDRTLGRQGEQRGKP
jgi:glycerol kinase